jgi:hypothetical protein
MDNPRGRFSIRIDSNYHNYCPANDGFDSHPLCKQLTEDQKHLIAGLNNSGAVS